MSGQGKKGIGGLLLVYLILIILSGLSNLVLLGYLLLEKSTDFSMIIMLIIGLTIISLDIYLISTKNRYAVILNKLIGIASVLISFVAPYGVLYLIQGIITFAYWSESKRVENTFKQNKQVEVSGERETSTLKKELNSNQVFKSIP